MKIYGLQKLTLLDYPGKVACTVFTGGCNMRCPFCHNASLVISLNEENQINENEFFSFLDKRKGILDGVCISGGEPLVQKDIESFIYSIKQKGFSVKLDTNGSFPEKLIGLCEKDLVDYVAMDIKNSLEKYPETIGVKNFDTSLIEKSVSYLMKSKTPFEFRTTVVRPFHTEDDFRKIGQWLKGAPKYYLQAFVDSGDLIGTGVSGFSEEEMKTFVTVLKKFIPSAELRGI